ncbi:DNA-binding transcriptional LysR family regulator [Paenibacillus taihuensis]|uniref:DNA-binding transcriptional LysR family regulator n=1 Tax=Paenibacillus taihuensis TaxID=1156355 RepID=A0A3D9S229_9BACL|nr:LysR family transcriptional regulator [Paenibacillus taihuensis]REE83944.1 DNA-binding transcriptional LysR family regulator [Paenibacillus taihuensis]
MDIRQLKYFLTIAQEKQITRAAKLLHMEQPPLSRQLMLMEEELGAKLFERGYKELTLTAAGELLKVKAEALLLQLDETVNEVKELEAGVRGTLSIGAVVSCVSILPKPIGQFRARYPDVTYKIAEGDHFSLGEMLTNRAIELVVSRLPFESDILPTRLAVHQLPSDPYVALMPAAWAPASSDQAISIEELAQFDFLTLKTDKTIRMHERVVQTFMSKGHEPKIIGECSSVAIIMSLVAAGIGVTVFPKSVIASFPSEQVTVLELRDAHFESDVGIVWLLDQKLSRRAEHFIACFE